MDRSKVRSSCQLVGGLLLKRGTKICFSLLLALIVSISAGSTALGDPPIAPSDVPTVTSDYIPALSTTQQVVLAQTKSQIVTYSKLVWQWESLMGLRRTRFSTGALRTHNLPYARWVLKSRRQLSGRLHAQANRQMVKRTQFFLADAARLRMELGMGRARSLMSVQGVEARFSVARRRVRELTKEWQSSSLYADLMCIHSGMQGSRRVGSGEGGMTSVSSTNPPYYGGWQMDITFQLKYGRQFYDRWGTADHWPAWAQLETAVTAYRSGRGFGPWPNTARDCGLL